MTEYHKVSVFFFFFFASDIFNQTGYDALKQQEAWHKETVSIPLRAVCYKVHCCLLFPTVTLNAGKNAKCKNAQKAMKYKKRFNPPSKKQIT